jgi:hypothetical protein
MTLSAWNIDAYPEFILSSVMIRISSMNLVMQRACHQGYEQRRNGRGRKI